MSLWIYCALYGGSACLLGWRLRRLTLARPVRNTLFRPGVNSRLHFRNFPPVLTGDVLQVSKYYDGVILVSLEKQPLIEKYSPKQLIVIHYEMLSKRKLGEHDKQ